jgi:hypothetical protein
VERVGKWTDELHAIVTGRQSARAGRAKLDPVRVLRAVASRLAPELQAAGVAFELLVPAELPAVSGDAAQLEKALVLLVRERLADLETRSPVTLAARAVGKGEGRALVVSVIDFRSASASASGSGESEEVREAVTRLRGRVASVALPGVGRATSIQLGVAGPPSDSA